MLAPTDSLPEGAWMVIIIHERHRERERVKKKKGKQRKREIKKGKRKIKESKERRAKSEAIISNGFNGSGRRCVSNLLFSTTQESGS